MQRNVSDSGGGLKYISANKHFLRGLQPASELYQLSNRHFSVKFSANFCRQRSAVWSAWWIPKVLNLRANKHQTLINISIYKHYFTQIKHVCLISRGTTFVVPEICCPVTRKLGSIRICCRTSHLFYCDFGIYKFINQEQRYGVPTAFYFPLFPLSLPLSAEPTWS
jgi:hypothetical protein